MTPYWRHILAPELRKGRTVVVVGHGNALRVLMHLSTGMPLEQASQRELRTAAPVAARAQLDPRLENA